MLGCDVGNSVCMIVKNNWLSSDTLKTCRDTLLNYGIKEVVNYPNVGEVFKGVYVSVSIVYAKKAYTGNTHYLETTNDTVASEYSNNIRGMDLVPSSLVQYNIIKKVTSSSKVMFGGRVVANLPFGIESNGRAKAVGDGSFIDQKRLKDSVYDTGILYYGNPPTMNYMRNLDIYKSRELIGRYKALCGYTINKSQNCVTCITKLGPNEICTGSYSVLYSDNEEYVIDNVIKYIKTRFFRILTYIICDNMCRMATNRLKLVPNQNFTSISDIDWSQSIADIDQQLYRKYNLTSEEIAYIEKTIKPME